MTISLPAETATTSGAVEFIGNAQNPGEREAKEDGLSSQAITPPQEKDDTHHTVSVGPIPNINGVCMPNIAEAGVPSDSPHTSDQSGLGVGKSPLTDWSDDVRVPFAD